MEQLRLRLIILPTEDQMDTYLELSKQLAQFSSNYITLGSTCDIPHISLYAPDFPVDTIGNVINAAQQLQNEFSAFTVNFEGLVASPHDNDGGVFVAFIVNDKLTKLRQRGTEILNPLRRGITRKKCVDLSKFTKPEQDEIKQYGYIMSKYQFPHITVSKFVDPSKKVDAITSLPPINIPPLKVQRLGICRSGEHGVCSEILSEFNLPEPGEA